MNSGTVNLIATDPPFNKNRDFHADPGSLASGAGFVDRWAWERDVHQEWVDAIKDDWPGVWQAIENGRVNHSAGMAAFLCWMGIRLIECRRVLADDGSIYLHIDHTAHAYVKCLMDAILGQRNFRNAIVWRRTGSHNSADRFGPIHDTILSTPNRTSMSIDRYTGRISRAMWKRTSSDRTIVADTGPTQSMGQERGTARVESRGEDMIPRQPADIGLFPKSWFWRLGSTLHCPSMKNWMLSMLWD